MTTATVISPLPKFIRHPLRWTRNRVQTLGTSLFLGHVGVLAIVGLYYATTQTIHPVTYHWNHLLSTDIRALSTSHWAYWRHLVRNVGEGLFGGFLAQQVIFNPFKMHKDATWLDRLEIKLHIPNLHQRDRVSAWQLLSSPGVAAVYAIPGFVLGALAAKGLHSVFNTEHVRLVASAHPSLVQKLYTDNWDQKLVGFVASVFVARRPMKMVWKSVQLFFAHRRVALGRKTHFYHPPAFKLLVSQIEKYGRDAASIYQKGHGWLVPLMMTGSLVVTAGLAGLGYYVLTNLA